MNRNIYYYNRIDNPKQRTQLFYAISLKEKLLRLYNQGGNLKIIRKLPIPDGTRIAKAGPYIICYSFNRITLIHLLNPYSRVYQCQWNGYPITKACYDEKTKLVFFIEDNTNCLYYLMPELTTMIIKFLYQVGQKVSKLQVYSDTSLGLLCPQSKSILKLTFNWKSDDQILQKQIIRGITDCYIAQNWVVYICSESQQGGQGGKKLSINDQWFHSLPEGGDHYVMSHRGMQSFLFLGLATKQLIMVHNEQMISYSFKVQLPNLISDQFLFAALEQIQFQLLLVIKTFDREEMKFSTYSYPIVRVKNKDADIVFAKNIKYIFMPNGLINPHLKGMLVKYCQREQMGRDDQSLDQKKQQLKVPQQDESEKLAYYFFCLVVKTKPEFLQEIINSIIKASKQYLLQAESKRFMDYCEKFIHINLRTKISNYAKLLEEKKIKNFNSQHLVNNCKQIVYFLKRMIEAIQHQCTNYSDIKQSQRLLNYKQILQCAKSYQLISQILGLSQLNERIYKLFNYFLEQKSRDRQIWSTNTIWVKNQFDTLLCHEHFKKIKLLQDKIPRTHQIFKFLMNNAQQYEEIAYFYIYLAKPLTVPYMPTHALNFYQLLQKYPAMSTLQSRDEVKEILSTIVSYAIQLGKFPFIKYLCQVAINYQCYPQCLILLQSEIYQNSMLEHSQEDLMFALKCFVIMGKISLGYLWIRKLKSSSFDQQQALKYFVELCVSNNRIQQFLILQFEQKELIKQQLKQSMKSQDYNKIQGLFPK